MKMKKQNVHLIEECQRGKLTAQLAPLSKQFCTAAVCRLSAYCRATPEAEGGDAGFFPENIHPPDQYRDGQCFEAWMNRIAVHTAIDYDAPTDALLEELSDDYTEPDDDGPDEEEIRYSVAQAKRSRKKLPVGYRVILCLFEGYDSGRDWLYPEDPAVGASSHSISGKAQIIGHNSSK